MARADDYASVFVKRPKQHKRAPRLTPVEQIEAKLRCGSPLSHDEMMIFMRAHPWNDPWWDANPTLIPF